jgi:hypothetical protein
LAEAINRHDARMLQPARDLGFEQSACGSPGIRGNGISFRATSRLSSSSCATYTKPSPPWHGRGMRNVSLSNLMCQR